MTYWLIFLTGLTTGGLSCIAVQGGLLASAIANEKDGELQKPTDQTLPHSFDQLDWLPVLLFLFAKLIAYTVLGLFLGMLGSVITLSLSMRLFFQVLAAVFMFATAMNLLDVHPIFRYVVIQPPRFIQRYIRNTSKSKALFTPAVLGLLTVFIPCGITQAMEVLAINSASPAIGALTMFSFVLGTSPIFALIGVATAKLSELWNKRFLRITAALLIFMTLYSINGILNVLDSPITGTKLIEGTQQFLTAQKTSIANASLVPQLNGKQKVMINITSHGYTPKRFTVKAGVPLEMVLTSDNAYSCATSFTFHKFGVRLQLGPTDSASVTILPTEKGEFTYSCSMGMYTGVMEVI